MANGDKTKDPTEPKLQKVYNYLKSNNKVRSGSYEEFQQKMSDPAKLEKVYSYLREQKKVRSENFDQFRSSMFPDQAKPIEKPAAPLPGGDPLTQSILATGNGQPKAASVTTVSREMPAPIPSPMLPQDPVQQFGQIYDDPLKAMTSIMQQGQVPQEQQIQRERNPFTTSWKKIREIGGYQLPAAMASATAAGLGQVENTFRLPEEMLRSTGQLPANYSRQAADEIQQIQGRVDQGFQRMMGLAKEGTLTQKDLDTYFAFKDKADERVNFLNKNFDPKYEGGKIKEMQKNLMRWAIDRQAKGQELSNDLVNSLSQVDDWLDAVNWAAGALAETGTQVVGAVATLGSAGAGQEVGSIYMDAINEIAQQKGITPEEVIERGLDSPAAALAYGGSAALLENIGVAGLIGKFTKSDVTKSLRQRALKHLKEFGSGGLSESETELAQTLLEKVGVAETTGGKVHLSKEEAAETVARAFFGGSTIGAAGSVVSSARQQAADKKAAAQQAQLPTAVAEQAQEVTAPPQEAPVEAQAEPAIETPAPVTEDVTTAPVEEEIKPSPDEQPAPNIVQPEAVKDTGVAPETTVPPVEEEKAPAPEVKKATIQVKEHPVQIDAKAGFVIRTPEGTSKSKSTTKLSPEDSFGFDAFIGESDKGFIVTEGTTGTGLAPHGKTPEQAVQNFRERMALAEEPVAKRVVNDFIRQKKTTSRFKGGKYNEDMLSREERIELLEELIPTSQKPEELQRKLDQLQGKEVAPRAETKEQEGPRRTIVPRYTPPSQQRTFVTETKPQPLKTVETAVKEPAKETVSKVEEKTLPLQNEDISNKGIKPTDTESVQPQAKSEEKRPVEAPPSKREQTRQSLVRLRDQGLLVTAAKKKGKKKEGKPAPMTDAEIDAQMSLMDAMAETWKKTTGKDDYYDRFIADVKEGDLRTLEKKGGSLFQEEAVATQEKPAKPPTSRVTLAVLNEPQFAKMKGQNVAVQQLRDLIKGRGKQIEKDVVNSVLEQDKYKNQKRVPFDEFRNDVEIQVMKLEPIRTDSYATYGEENLGGNENYGDAETIIFNSPIHHGEVGHFRGDFNVAGLQKTEWELRQLGNTDTWAAVDKNMPSDVTEATIANYVGTAGPKNVVEKWIADRSGEEGDINVGLFGHIRRWFNKRSGVFHIAELQSDYFQKNKASDLLAEQVHPDEVNAHMNKNVWKPLDNALAEKIVDRMKFKIQDTGTGVEAYSEDGTLLKRLEFDDSPSVGLEIGDHERAQVAVYALQQIAYKGTEAEAFLDEIREQYRADRERLKNPEEQKFIQQRMAEIKEENKGKENLPLKQFIASQKLHETRLLREAIKTAAEEGATTVRFPAPYTLAVIEGYVDKSGDGAAPYEIIRGRTDGGDLEPGDTIDYGGTTMIVVEATSTTITVADEDKVNSWDYGDLLDHEADYRYEDDVKYPASKHFNSLEEITKAELETWEPDYSWAERAKKMMEDYFEDNPEEETLSWNKVVRDDITDEIREDLGTWNIEDLVGYSTVYMHGDDVYAIEGRNATEEFNQPDQYQAESTEDDYEDNLSDGQQTVVDKYKELNEVFKKMRPDAEFVRDDNNMEWLESKITDADRENPIVAFQNQGAKVKGAIDFTNDNKATIHIFDGADISTLAHEATGHLGRRVLEQLAEADSVFKKDYNNVKKWAGVKDNVWTRGAEEKFARAFEKYLREGKAPTLSLESVFDQLKGWLKNIYKAIKGSEIDVELTDEVRAVFDKLLGKEDAVQKRSTKKVPVGKSPTDSTKVEPGTPESKKPPVQGERKPAVSQEDKAKQKVEKGKQKVADSLQALAAKLGTIKTVNPLDDSSVWEDVKNLMDGLSDMGIGKAEEVIAYLKKELKKLGVKPEHVEEKADAIIEHLNPPTERPKALLTRAHEGTPNEEVAQAIEEFGLTYKQESHDEAKQKAYKFIKEVGIVAAMEAVKSNQIKGAPAAFVWAETIDAVENEIAKTTDPKRMEELADLQSQLAHHFDVEARLGGQFISALREVYANSDYNYSAEHQIDIYRNENKGKIDPEVEQKFRAMEAEMKKINDELKKAQREKAKAESSLASLKDQISEERKTRKRAVSHRKKEINDFFDNWKVDTKGTANDISRVITAAVWNGAVEVMKRATMAGYDVSRIMQEGIDYIKKHYKGDDFNEEDFKKFAEPKLSRTLPKTKTTDIGDITITDIDGKKKITIPEDFLKDLIESGAETIEEVTAEVMKIIDDPSITERQVRDAITRYGEVRKLSQAEVDVKLRQMKRIGQLISKLEDVEAMERPRRSGLQRDSVTDTERRLQQQLKEAMKDLPMDQTDIERELKTSLDTVKSRLRNQIEDLKSGVLPSKKKGIEYDDEAKKLKAERDVLRKEIEKENGRQDISEEEKVKRAIGLVERSIEDYQRRIDTMNFEATTKDPVSSPELQALKDERERLKDVFNNLKEISGFAAQKRQDATKAAARKAIADYQARVKLLKEGGRYVKPTKKELEVDKEIVQLRARKAAIKGEFDRLQYHNELANRTRQEKIIDGLWEAWGITRALRATGEFSFVLLQGGVLTLSSLLNVTNPKMIKAVGTAFVRALNHMANAENHERWLSTLKGQEYYERAKASKLAITEPDAKLSAREEQFLTGWVNNIWDLAGYPIKLASKRAFDVWKAFNPTRAVERAGVAYLNTLRLERYIQGEWMLERDGKNFKDNPEDYKHMADVINTFTGRASLGKLEAMAKPLSVVFFSPRNWASTLKQTVFFLPYLLMKRSKTNKWYELSVAQKMALGDYMRYVGATAGILTLIAATQDDDDEDGWKIDFDPRSTNFLKLRSGNTTIDPWGGRSQMVTLLARVIGGSIKDSAGRVRDEYQDVLLWRSIKNKLAPTAAIFARFTGSKKEKKGPLEFRADRYGNIYNLSEDVLQNLYPIYFDTVRELRKEQPTTVAAFLVTMAFFGLGTQVYSKEMSKQENQEKMKQLIIDFKAKQKSPVE